jgi:hypothetical protein
MPTSILAAAVPALVSTGASMLGSSLLGGGNPTAPLQNFQPSNINAGGLTSTTGRGGVINVTPSAERLGFVSNISNAFGNLGGELSALRSRVAPGVSELRSSRLAEIEDARNRAIGDLRENLARRRVLGSSFGQDAISRAESEFAGQREKVAAESTLAELEMTNNIINQQFNAQRGQFQTFLDELNLQADVATKLAGKATDTMAANARLLSQLNVMEAQGAGKFFGQAFQPVGQAAGKSLGSFLSGGGGGGFKGGDFALAM